MGYAFGLLALIVLVAIYAEKSLAIKNSLNDNNTEVNWLCLPESIQITLRDNNFHGRIEVTCENNNTVTNYKRWRKTLHASDSGSIKKYNINNTELYSNCGAFNETKLTYSIAIEVLQHKYSNLEIRGPKTEEIKCVFDKVNKIQSTSFKREGKVEFSLELENASAKYNTNFEQDATFDVELGAHYTLVGRLHNAGDSYRVTSCRTYDINLWGHDVDNAAGGSVSLLDDWGCSIDETLLRDVRHAKTRRKSLANDAQIFSATIPSMFKFQSSDIVILECTVTKQLDRNLPNCEGASSTSRRQLFPRAAVESTQVPTSATKTERSESHNTRHDAEYADEEGSGEGGAEKSLPNATGAILQDEFQLVPSPAQHTFTTSAIVLTAAGSSAKLGIAQKSTSTNHKNSGNSSEIGAQIFNFSFQSTTDSTYVKNGLANTKAPIEGSTRSNKVVTVISPLNLKKGISKKLNEKNEMFTARLVLHVGANAKPIENGSSIPGISSEKTDTNVTNSTLDTLGIYSPSSKDDTLLLYQQLCVVLSALLLASSICQALLLCCCCCNRRKHLSSMSTKRRRTSAFVKQIANEDGYDHEARINYDSSYWISPVASTAGAVGPHTAMEAQRKGSTTYLPYYSTSQSLNNRTSNYGTSELDSVGFDVPVNNPRISLSSYASVKRRAGNHRILDPISLATIGGDTANQLFGNQQYDTLKSYHHAESSSMHPQTFSEYDASSAGAAPLDSARPVSSSSGSAGATTSFMGASTVVPDDEENRSIDYGNQDVDADEDAEDSLPAPPSSLEAARPSRVAPAPPGATVSPFTGTTSFLSFRSPTELGVTVGSDAHAPISSCTSAASDYSTPTTDSSGYSESRCTDSSAEHGKSARQRAACYSNSAMVTSVSSELGASPIVNETFSVL